MYALIYYYMWFYMKYIVKKLQRPNTFCMSLYALLLHDKCLVTFSGSKGGKRKFHDVWKSKFSWLIYNYDSSNNVNYVV
jgi:hypothetical protein